MLHKNWNKFFELKKTFSIVEYPIYSDITVTGELLEGLEPLTFHNTIPHKKLFGEVVIPAVVRVGISVKYEGSDWSKSNYKHYHGGWLNDEIAALMSLILGARFHAGDSIREFGGYIQDPMGTPRFSNLSYPPLSYIKEKNHILPEATQSKCLNDLAILSKFPHIPHKTAEKVIQCARQYQNALWLSETNPEMCWLMLVSAIEIAANTWNDKEKSDVENLEISHPEFYGFIKTLENDKLVEIAASTFGPITKSSSKFMKFCMQYTPENLYQHKSNGFDYQKDNLKKSLNKIYSYRSQALHAGIPFPAPMCDPPLFLNDNFWQRPAGLASYTKGAIWKNEDMPMNLHFFNFLTRTILNNWLKQLLAPSDGS